MAQTKYIKKKKWRAQMKKRMQKSFYYLKRGWFNLQLQLFRGFVSLFSFDRMKMKTREIYKLAFALKLWNGMALHNSRFTFAKPAYKTGIQSCFFVWFLFFKNHFPSFSVGWRFTFCKRKIWSNWRTERKKLATNDAWIKFRFCRTNKKNCEIDDGNREPRSKSLSMLHDSKDLRRRKSYHQ